MTLSQDSAVWQFQICGHGGLTMTEESARSARYAIDRFWHNYLSIVEKSSIPNRARRWYRQHAEAYIKAHKSTRLAEHMPQLVDSYLNGKGRTPGYGNGSYGEKLSCSLMTGRRRVLPFPREYSGGIHQQTLKDWSVLVAAPCPSIALRLSPQSSASSLVGQKRTVESRKLGP
jgi:hypothetical protein